MEEGVAVYLIVIYEIHDALGAYQQSTLQY